MTEEETRAEAQAVMGELIYSLAGFMRHTVPNQVGDSTVHLIVDRPAWERLLGAAAKVADR